MAECHYKVVALPRTLAVMKKAFKDFGARDRAETVAVYLQKVTFENTAEGWEFYRIDEVNLHQAAGCVGSLFGQTDQTTSFNVATFRKESLDEKNYAREAQYKYIYIYTRCAKC